MSSSAVPFRRHEAADGRTHADDAGTPPHDASPSAHDDARQARHDATGQIRAGGSPLLNSLSSEDARCNTWILKLSLNVLTTVPDVIM